MTDVLIKRELLERLAEWDQFPHKMKEALTELRAILTSQPQGAPAEKQYPSMSLYPDAKEYAAACGEVAGWNACRKAMLDAAAAQPVALREKCPCASQARLLSCAIGIVCRASLISRARPRRPQTSRLYLQHATSDMIIEEV